MSFWLSSWACLLSLGWLLPNHYRPWTAFHNEIWVGLIIFLPGLALFRELRERDACDFLWCLILLFCLLPFLQWAFGLVPFFGSALLFSLYLFSLLLALRIGQEWDRAHPGFLIDRLFLSMGMASFLSVYLQLNQKFEIDVLGIWMVHAGSRPAANLAQPNNLATLLCLGMLSVLWAWVRGFAGRRYAILGLGFLGIGVYLTASRTGVLGMMAVMILALRLGCLVPVGYSGSKRQRLIVFMCLALLAVSTTMLLDLGVVAERVRSDLRFTVWPAFLDAILQRPWFGFGVGESAKAQLQMAHAHPPSYVVFGSAHNVVIDIFVWFGVPLGLLAVFGVARWFFKICAHVRGAEGSILKGVLVVVGIHAMTEFPLQYAYFLMPVGIVVGTLTCRSNIRTTVFISRKWTLMQMIVVAGVTSLVVRDYMYVEEDYSILRAEWAGFRSGRHVEPAALVVLDQWERAFRLARFDTTTLEGDVDIRRVEEVVWHFHSPIYFKKLIEILRRRGDVDGASRWLDDACQVVRPHQCLELRSRDPDSAPQHSAARPTLLVLPRAPSE